MRKQYIQPTLSTDAVEPVYMLAASTFMKSDQDNMKVDLNDEEYEGEFSTKSGGEFLWDE